MKLGNPELTKEEKRDRFIDWEIERIKALQKRKQELLKNDTINSLSEYMQREMIERGNMLDPYEAMLHARKMAKKVSIEQNKLLKKSSAEQIRKDSSSNPREPNQAVLQMLCELSDLSESDEESDGHSSKGNDGGVRAKMKRSLINSRNPSKESVAITSSALDEEAYQAEREFIKEKLRIFRSQVGKRRGVDQKRDTSALVNRFIGTLQVQNTDTPSHARSIKGRTADLMPILNFVPLKKKQRRDLESQF